MSFQKKMNGRIESMELTVVGESGRGYLGVLVEKLLNGYSLDIESILKIMRREEFRFLVDYRLLMIMLLQRPDQCINLQK